MQNKKNKSDLTSEELASLEIQEAREKMYKLVLKIICWQTGSKGSSVVQSEDKITPTEWQSYKKHRLKLLKSWGRDKADEELTETYDSIKAHGGFA